MSKPEITLREHLSQAGKAGRGASKRRSREHYQRAAAVRWANERARLTNAQHVAPGEKP